MDIFDAAKIVDELKLSIKGIGNVDVYGLLRVSSN
jgi:hypothetical protein